MGAVEREPYLFGDEAEVKEEDRYKYFYSVRRNTSRAIERVNVSEKPGEAFGNKTRSRESGIAEAPRKAHRGGCESSFPFYLIYNFGVSMS